MTKDTRGDVKILLIFTGIDKIPLKLRGPVCSCGRRRDSPLRWEVSTQRPGECFHLWGRL